MGLLIAVIEKWKSGAEYKNADGRRHTKSRNKQALIPVSVLRIDFHILLLRHRR
jgi:hypothetical protein